MWAERDGSDKLILIQDLRANNSVPKGKTVMELHELVLEMKQLERRLMLYEEKYGFLSQDFMTP